MLEYAKLADVSTWQGIIDYDVFTSRDLDGVIIRAGSINYVTGIPYTDYQFERNADLSADKFDVLGYYWYWRANQDPLVQANYFSNLVQYKKRTLPLVADVESTNDIPKELLAARLKAFLDKIEEHTGERPIIYTRATFWNTYVGNPSWAYKYKLWAARYRYLDSNLEPDLTSPWSDGNYEVNGWNEWLLWQYSADGNGLGSYYGVDNSAIDLNYFNGTKDDLYKFANIENTPQPETVEISRDLALQLYEELKGVLK